MYLYPYRAGEVQLPAPGPVTEGVTVSAVKLDNSEQRLPAAVSLPVYCSTAVPPRVDTRDAITAMAGAQKRFLHEPPPANHQLLAELKRFVTGWLVDHVPPLPSETDVSFENWIEHTNYSRARKEELSNIYHNTHDLWENEKYYRNKSFIKDEFYTDYKHARCINSRTDEFKVLTGPYFHQIETEVFKNPAFVKFVPVMERATYIRDRLGVGVYIATDYSSFEALFTPELMDAVELSLYVHMLASVVRGGEISKIICDALSGENRSDFKCFSAWVLAKRMSGDMCTSLGNGFMNFIIMEFWSHLRNVDCVGVFEGDDGLVKFDRWEDVPTDEFFLELGLEIKIERHMAIHTAAFCSLLFDPVSCLTVTDVRYVLASFGWVSDRFSRAKPVILLSLLRCKAISMLVLLHSCPVIGVLARRLITLTEGVDETIGFNHSSLTWWDRQRYAVQQLDWRCLMSEFTTTAELRAMVEELQGISVSHQLVLEEFCASLTFGAFDIGLEFPASWVDNTQRIALYPIKARAGDGYIDQRPFPHVWDLMGNPAPLSDLQYARKRLSLVKWIERIARGRDGPPIEEWVHLNDRIRANQARSRFV